MWAAGPPEPRAQVSAQLGTGDLAQPHPVAGGVSPTPWQQAAWHLLSQTPRPFRGEAGPALRLFLQGQTGALAHVCGWP